MSPRRTQIAIIGGGLAAHSAARCVARAGADALMIHPQSPGATGLWSGLGQAYGPASDFPSRAVGLFGECASLPPGIRTKRADRFFALGHRRQFHPYQRLGLAQADLQRILERAVDTLDYPGLRVVKPELVIPSAAAAPYPADLAATSVLNSAIGRGERVGVVACPALLDWFPERLVEALSALTQPDPKDGASVELIEIDLFDKLGTHQLHSAIIAAHLAGALDAEPARLVDALRPHVENHQLDLLILPPCIGSTWPEHTRWMNSLQDALPCRVAESAAARNSIHGWRLDRYLRGNNPVESVTGRARGAAIENDQMLSVETPDGPFHADAFILATGRWVGRGLPGGPPFRDPILNADLWIDGASMPDPDHTWLRDLLDAQPWQDHPYFRAGIATDPELRPLDLNGAPVAQNVFAAGRVLAGFNPFWDGTTEGVDLITGYIAAHNALAHIGLKSAESTSNRSDDLASTSKSSPAENEF